MMRGPFSFTKEKKQAIIALLLEMAGVDQHLDETEEKYIQEIARQMDLDPGAIEMVRKTPEKYPFYVPKDEHERMTILYYVIFLMRADGKILPSEEELCYKVGLKLGFNHNMVMDLIAVLKVYLNEDVPPEIMLEHVRKYLN